MNHFLQKISRLKPQYKLSLLIGLSAITLGAAVYMPAHALMKHNDVATHLQNIHTKSKEVTATVPESVAASPVVTTNAHSKITPKDTPVAAQNSAATSITKTVTNVKVVTPSSATVPVAPPAAPTSSEQGTYDGYGYHVQDTQIVDTISRASAQVCGGYLCGTKGPTISYNLSSPAAGSFQFVEGNDIANNVEFNIKSGGLSKGNSPAFSPVSISPNLPNGVYKGTIQLQFDTDTNDDYADGPAISYTVYLTD